MRKKAATSTERLAAIAAYQAGRSVPDIANDMGFNKSAVYNWIARAKKRPKKARRSPRLKNPAANGALGGNGNLKLTEHKPTNIGWICPICGRAVAPWKDGCC